MCWYLWLVIIFYSLQKYFPFCSSFFLPLLLLWASAISDIQRYSSTPVCLSVCLTHTQSLVYISSLTPSPGLKLLRAVFLPSYITCNRQRALDCLRWWRFIWKTPQRKRERPHREAEAQQHTARLHRRERCLSRAPRGSPDAHVALLYPPTWQGLLSTLATTRPLLDASCFTLTPSFSLPMPWLLSLPTALCRSRCLDFRAELSLTVWVLPPRREIWLGSLPHHPKWSIFIGQRTSRPPNSLACFVSCLW